MGSVGQDTDFLRSKHGIFKIAAWIVNLIALIVLAASQFWAYAGVGSVHAANFTFSFVAVSLLISIFIYFCKLYNLPLAQRLTWKTLEFVYGVICTLLYFLSMIICGWAANFAKNSNIYGSFAGSAVLAAILLVAFAAFSFFIFRADSVRSQPEASTANV